MSKKGFTLTEVIVVLVMVAVLAAIATPSFMTWRESVAFRATAREISNLLREAKSRTVARNLQHRVEFVTAPTGMYRMTQGDRAASSSAWYVPGTTTVATSASPAWTAAPPKVSLVVSDNNISFNPNGTANLSGTSASISLLASSGTTTRFTVTVMNTGKIGIK
jgi:prepilin-type N-terminal cleavage/methylation domain-containing protein